MLEYSYSSLIHVQIRAADTRRRDFDNSIIRMLEFRSGDLFDRDLEWTLVVDGFHFVTHCV